MHKLDISCNRGLLHHQNLWCIPYLQAKFETHNPFLCLKQGPNTLPIAVTLLVYGLDRKCKMDYIQERIWRYRGRPDVNCIQCAMITHFPRSCGVGSPTTSASPYKLCNHCTISQYKCFGSCSPCSLSRCLRTLYKRQKWLIPCWNLAEMISRPFSSWQTNSPHWMKAETPTGRRMMFPTCKRCLFCEDIFCNMAECMLYWK